VPPDAVVVVLEPPLVVVVLDPPDVDVVVVLDVFGTVVVD